MRGGCLSLCGMALRPLELLVGAALRLRPVVLTTMTHIMHVSPCLRCPPSQYVTCNQCRQSLRAPAISLQPDLTALASMLVIYMTDEHGWLACATLEATQSLFELPSQSKIPYMPTIAVRHV